MVGLLTMPEPDPGYKHTDITGGVGPDTSDQLPPPPLELTTQTQKDCWAYLSTRPFTMFANWDISKRRGRIKASLWLASQVQEVDKVAKARRQGDRKR